MTFALQMLATLVGTVSGFVFSLLLYYLTEKWRRTNVRKGLTKNLRKELEFNLTLVNNLHAHLVKAIPQVAAGDTGTFPYFEYKSYQRFFFDAYFREGFLYELFTADEVKQFDIILRHFTVEIENWINGTFTKWKDGKTEQVELRRVLEFQRDQMEIYKVALHNAIAKLQ